MSNTMSYTKSYTTTETLPRIWFVDLRVEDENELVGAYIVASEEEVALVETGAASTAHKLIEAVHELGYDDEQVKYILPTHVHIDHAGGCGELIESFPNAPVLAHPRGAPHLIDPDAALWKAAKEVIGDVLEAYGKPKPVPEERILPYTEGMSLTLGARTLRILYTPGHASHHMSFMLEPEGVLFCGDAAGCHIPGLDVVFPISPVPFRRSMALDSLHLMKSIKPDYLGYTHFGLNPQPIIYLDRALEQYGLWERISQEALRKDLRDSEELMRLFADRDPNMRTIEENTENYNAVRRDCVTCVTGFVESARKEQAG